MTTTKPTGPQKPSGPHHPHPPDWSSSDTVLEHEIAEEERQIRVNRILTFAAFGLLALVIAALVLSIVALNRDIESVAKAEPKTGSVGASAIKPGAVTADKLAPNAVLNPAIANEAVGRNKLRVGAVDASRVAPDALTGKQINESSLGTVPKAQTAASAATLGGLGATTFLSGVKVTQSSSATSLAELKGPRIAACPTGTRIISGGASVEGSTDVAITRSAPDGSTGWIATAQSIGETTPWRLVVTAICAAGGS